MSIDGVEVANLKLNALFFHSRSGSEGNRFSGEWINEFERQSLTQRNPSFLEPQLVKNVLAVRDSPCINPLTFRFGDDIMARFPLNWHLQGGAAVGCSGVDVW